MRSEYVARTRGADATPLAGVRHAAGWSYGDVWFPAESGWNGPDIAVNAKVAQEQEV